MLLHLQLCLVEPSAAALLIPIVPVPVMVPPVIGEVVAIDITVPVALHERLPEASFLRKVFALPCVFGKVKECDEPPEAICHVTVLGVVSSKSILSEYTDIAPSPFTDGAN